MANSKDEQQTQLPTHGAAVLPSVKVDSYNLEVEDEEGFLGDKANRDAFWEILDKWRKPLQDQDPLGDKPSEEIGKKKLAALLTDGEPEAAGIVQSAIEDFAQQLALVLQDVDMRLVHGCLSRPLVAGLFLLFDFNFSFGCHD